MRLNMDEWIRMKRNLYYIRVTYMTPFCLSHSFTDSDAESQVHSSQGQPFSYKYLSTSR